MDPNQNVPRIQGGASLILAWQIKDKPVLVIGGGSVASSRVENLLAADAEITVIAPTLSSTLQCRLDRGEISYISRKCDLSIDLGSPRPSMVLVAIDDPIASSEIYKACHDLHIPVNVADVPPECDFYFGSMYRDGPLQIMVSTNGNGPKMASLVRKRIENELANDPFGIAIEKLGALRAQVRLKLPGSEKSAIRARMRWVSLLSEKWTISQLAALDDNIISYLVSHLDSDPPTYEAAVRSCN
ncbi:putative NAD(P)-binding-domain-containing protein [Lipomyces oligophaga]|uniref:putative NAD(P)-binding-domain-containing protein n=1 Tax=Lipomyces oligophaga TaxID=45792 RepID=UPI0034CD948C